MYQLFRKTVLGCGTVALLAVGAAGHAADKDVAGLLKGKALESAGQSATGGSSGAPGAGALLGGGTGALGASALGGSALGSLGLPSIAGGSAGNVAGVLEYCVKNNYLKKANVSSVKDGLLKKAGLGAAEPEKDSSYASGLGGVLSGGDGKSFDLSKIQDSVKEKACDHVLDNASSLL